MYPRQPQASARTATYRVIPANSRSLEDLAATLAQQGILEHPRIWTAYMRILGAGHQLRDVEVRLRSGMTPAQVARRVSEGLGRPDVRFTIPEGLNRMQIAERLTAQGVCDGERWLELTESEEVLRHHGIQAASIEGYLFPDTYEFAAGTREESVLTRFINNWRRRVLPLVETEARGLAALRERLGWGIHEVLTMASIVEKETGVSTERGTVAGVFINRLTREGFRPRRLQADPTVAYGCLPRVRTSPSCDGYRGGPITRSMLSDSENAYNTYRHEGLPPGPIANPGLSAIEAVLSPQGHDFFYFVAQGDGTHAFSETLEQHNAAVRRYRESQR